MSRKLLPACALALVIAMPGVSLAAGGGGGGGGGGGSSMSEEDAEWRRARDLVDDGSFQAAIPVLLEVVRKDDEHADAYNLLGFAHRKTGQLDAALKYYRKALELEPKHRGAHEYIGEAYLETGDLEGAKRHLAILDKDCFFGCKEFEQLKSAIAKYESR